MFVLEHPGKLTMEARCRILEDFRRGIEEDGVVLLWGGMTCKQYTTEEGEELKVVEYTLGNSEPLLDRVDKLERSFEDYKDQQMWQAMGDDL